MSFPTLRRLPPWATTAAQHALAWAIFWILLTVTVVSTDPDDSPLELLRFGLDIFGAFGVPIYLHFWLWSKTIAQRRYLTYGALSVVALGIWTYLSHAYASALRPNFPEETLAQTALNTFFVVLVATGIRAIYRLFVRDRELRELRAQRAESQLAALRAQVNPHFLFNTLNNIYAVNLDDPERGSRMLLELAEVMRYHYDLSRQPTVALGQEVQLIESVIALERLRLRENTSLTVDLPPPEATAGLQIAPLLLVPLVENAFKHGTHPTQPSAVAIRLSLDGEALRFEVRNTLHPNRRTVSTGVGLDNLRERLRLIYGEAARLSAGPSATGLSATGGTATGATAAGAYVAELRLPSLGTGIAPETAVATGPRERPPAPRPEAALSPRR